MGFLPVRVEAKTVDLPWVSFIFLAMMAVVTFFQFHKLDHHLENQAALPARVQYQWQLKKYLDKECRTYLDQVTCEVFLREVQAGYISDENALDVFLRARLSAERLEKLRIFLKPWRNEEAVLGRADAEPSLGAVRNALVAWREQKKQYHQGRDLLASEGRTLRSFLLAPFLHATGVQVLFLVLLFLLVAPSVEQRMGFFGFAIFLFTSGWLGTGAESFLLGARLQFGSIFVVQSVGAAFLVFFARHRVSFFNLGGSGIGALAGSSVVSKAGSKVRTGWRMTGVGFFVIWSLALQFSILGQEFIFPHVLPVPSSFAGQLLALGWGIAAALVMDRLFPVPEGMVYHYEKKLFEKANQVRGAQKQFQVFRHWFHLNPSSSLALHGLLESGRRLHEENEQDSLLKTFLTSRWSEIFRSQMLNQDFVAHIPYAWLREDVLDIRSEPLVHAIAFFANAKQSDCEWKLILCLLWGQRQKGYPDLEKRLIQLSDQVMHSLDFVSELQLACEKNRDLDEYLKKMGFWLNSNPGPGSATGTERI